MMALGPSRALPRNAAALVRSAMSWSRVVVLNGPRQSGKSTVLTQLSRDVGATVVTLDDRTVHRAARADPEGFLAGLGRPLFIDEVQRGGDGLVLAIKAMVDRDPSPGQVVVAGSSRFLTIPTLSESLAGRAHFVDLWPLTQGELAGAPGAQVAPGDGFVDGAFGAPADLRALCPPALNRRDYAERVVRGGFPGLATVPPEAWRDWFDDYVATIVQREVRELANLGRLSALGPMVALLGARTAQELNVADLARDVGLPAETTRAYLALLEQVYVPLLVPAWSRNLVSKQVRRPKLHVVDAGLAAHLQGVGVDVLANPIHAGLGSLLESFVVGEVVRQIPWSSTRPTLSHLRERGGLEVDLVLEARDGRVVAIEVKAAVGVDERDARWLRSLRDRLGPTFVHGIVLHAGTGPRPLGDRLTAMPISALWSTPR
jgi:predicted AAA+ superfamily ATPase